MQGILSRIRYFERELLKSFKKDFYFVFVSNCMSSVCHLHVIRISLVCTCTSSVCHTYVLVCHPYVTRMYSYVIRMSLVCTRMSSVCHSYVLVCHPYVTRLWFYHEPLIQSTLCRQVAFVNTTDTLLESLYLHGKLSRLL